MLDQRFGLYRVQPVGPVAFTPTNPRPATPDGVGGDVEVASNVLNYFNGDGLGGGLPDRPWRRDASSSSTARKPRSSAPSPRIDADVVGLMEIENDAGRTSAIAQLVAALNAAIGPGTYAFVDTGIIGTDAIQVGLHLQAERRDPGRRLRHARHRAVDPRFIDTQNRPALAQTFSAERQRRTRSRWSSTT